MQVAILGT